MTDRFYITTPIYYPNGEPHLGHVYTTLAADTLARYHRLRGDDTRLLTGTDEHGIKMVKSAAEKGTEPRVLADQMSAVFRSTFERYHVTNDDFIRTTEPRHARAVQEIIRRMLASDDIYLGEYEGWYDEGQEEFVTETDAKARDYKSAISGRPLVRYTEKTFFFRLTKYAPKVLEHINANPQFIQPESRRNEVVSKLSAGVNDLSISRTTLKWGIPFPNDPSHVVYVWIDALSNYITALGYASDDQTLFKRFWPVDVHLIGREILWFHTVYWPAMLMSLGLPLPRTVFAHGWWTANGQKMSKSMGNFIGLEQLATLEEKFGQDAIRFYILRAAPFGSDLDWNDTDFAKCYNELANVVGNLLNRVLNMLGKYRGGVVPAVNPTEDIDRALLNAITALPAALDSAYANIELQQAAVLPIELARQANGYVDATAPFKLAKDPAQAQRLDTVLGLAARAARDALIALLPVLPDKAAAGLKQLNVAFEGKALSDLLTSDLPAGHQLGQAAILFPKLDAKP